jgi:1-deoxy-D-xylulose-5-phosphate synthase
MHELTIGKGSVVAKGKEVAILSFGTTLEIAKVVGTEVGATVINMRFVKPMDQELILEIATSHRFIFTIEENMVAGGAGSAVNEVLAEKGLLVEVANYGLPDRLIQHGSRDDMLADAGLTESAFKSFVKKRTNN